MNLSGLDMERNNTAADEWGEGCEKRKIIQTIIKTCFDMRSKRDGRHLQFICSLREN